MLTRELIFASMLAAMVPGCAPANNDPLKVSLFSDGRLELNGKLVSRVELLSEIEQASEAQRKPLTRELWLYREHPSEELTQAQRSTMDALFQFSPIRGLDLKMFDRPDFSPSSEILLQ